ncbi:MAG: DUF1553 domain-containing protein [Isosphaeraceae bacterium]|nr:DUF1553 domain-containing protein [Isosphaeraceae bacterium]
MNSREFYATRIREVAMVDRRIGSVWLGMAVLCTSWTVAAARGDDSKGEEFFERKIRPVLAQHCLECHAAPVGKKGPKGGLRLDHREAVRTGGDSGPAVVPGKPEESLLLEVLEYRDALRMPPKRKLPESVIADFRTWIAMGAPDPREAPSAKVASADPLAKAKTHWAYQPIREPAIPKPLVDEAGSNEIDRFVAIRLESVGLPPAEEASRSALIRRLTFDLVGLPPTPEDVRAFEADARPDAYERLVDRLLASPAFGERWGRHWLDVARFAESLTLRGMIYTDAWRYRDYVIEAFRTDRPFDRFVREQISGDLMHADSIEERRRQLVAVAYLALGNSNLEEQDKAQLRMDVVDEQLDTIGKGLIAQTLGCARCHDHKFDPIPTRDYYAMAGILRSTRVMEHANVSKWLDRPLPMDPSLESAAEASERAIAAVEKSLAAAKASATRAGKVAKGVVAPSDLPGVVIDDSRARKVGSWTLSRFSGAYIGDGYLHDENAGKGEKTLTFQPDRLPPGEYEVRLAYAPGSNRSKRVSVTVMSAEGEKSVEIDETRTPPIAGRFVSLGRHRFEEGGLAFVLVSNEGATGHVVADAVQFLGIGRDTNPRGAVSGSSAPASEVDRLEDELTRLRASAPPRDRVVSVFEEKAIEDAKVHVRGSVHTLGEVAPRGFLRCVSGVAVPAPPSHESGRRELADWLTSTDNPLTRRVYVNRVWHWLMGEGLVRTPDNFGTTGESPSHPELLDHLAVVFARDGWSTKRLVRSIVTSRTYRRSSTPGPRASELDPENRLLSHMRKRRLDAESLRDAMLAAGQGIESFQGGPAFPVKLASDYGFTLDRPIRSVYLPVFRNALPEIFEVFDFADPSVVVGARNNATVAPQALFLLNHPFVAAQARAAARRVLALPDFEGRIERLSLASVGRLPTAGERTVARRFIDASRPADADAELEVWSMIAQALFASPDFRTLD